MAAGLEGAGRESSIGINIRLPFEQGANEFIAADPKLISMKYFFTRKLMLMKDSDGFVVLPGGFGTLDETFELLTLIQTGKIQNFPIVVMGTEYWRELTELLVKMARLGTISAADLNLVYVTDSVEEALEHIRAKTIEPFGLRRVVRRPFPWLGEQGLDAAVP